MNSNKNRRTLSNMVEISDTINNLLEQIESAKNNNSEKHFATAQEIAKARSEYGWSTIFGILVNPYANTQIVVNPKKDAVYIINNDGPITANRLNEALKSPRRNFISTNNSQWKNGLALTDNEVEEITTKYKPEARYDLSELKKIQSREYNYNKLLITNNESSIRPLKFAYPQANILDIISGGDIEIAKNYLYKLIEMNISNSSNNYNKTTQCDRVYVHNPFENLNVKKPFASIIQFYGGYNNVQDVGFKFNTLYLKGNSQINRTESMLQIPNNTNNILTVQENRFHIAQTYLLAREFIPPILIQKYEKQLHDEWRNLNREI